MRVRELYNSASVNSGVQCVTIYGPTMMLWWYVDSSAIKVKVCALQFKFSHIDISMLL